MHPSTCCGISADNGCCCAKQAKCACGKELALQCKCGDHTVSGPRCSCSEYHLDSNRVTYTVTERFSLTVSVLPGQRPAGQCTCERSISENSPVKGPTCPCGRRPAGMSISISSLLIKILRVATVRHPAGIHVVLSHLPFPMMSYHAHHKIENGTSCGCQLDDNANMIGRRVLHL